VLLYEEANTTVWYWTHVLITVM